MTTSTTEAKTNASSDVTSTSGVASATPETTYASTIPLTNTEALVEHTPAAHGETGAMTEHPTGEGGLPQLDTAQWPGQILWLLIIFAVFYFTVSRSFAPKLRKVISNRGSTIAEDLANARANRDEAEAQAKQAAAEMAAAQATARKLAAEALAKSQAEVVAEQAAEDERLSVKLAEAESKIRDARNKAMSHVKEIAVETAQAMIEKLTGKAATDTALKEALEKH